MAYMESGGAALPAHPDCLGKPLLDREVVVIADAVVLDVRLEHDEPKHALTLRQRHSDRNGLPRLPAARVGQCHGAGDVDAISLDAELCARPEVRHTHVERVVAGLRGVD